MAAWEEVVQRPEALAVLGVLVVIIVMLAFVIFYMRRRALEQARWFREVEHAIMDGISEKYEFAESRSRAAAEQARLDDEARSEMARQLDDMRGDLAKALNEQAGATLSVLNNLAGRLGQLGKRLDGIRGATGELREAAFQLGQQRERLNVSPRGDLPAGQLDALLMQWFAPGRYVRDFEVGAGSGNYADVAILLPDDDGKALYMPVDMSFPVEEFTGEWNDEARSRLSQRLAEHAHRLASRLIEPGLTTDFVIMLLRSELVAERVGELDAALVSAQLTRQVVAVGPATFWSIARALDGGVSALEVRRSTRQLEQLMADMRAELGRFTRMMEADDMRADEYQPRRRARLDAPNEAAGDARAADGADERPARAKEEPLGAEGAAGPRPDAGEQAGSCAEERREAPIAPAETECGTGSAQAEECAPERREASVAPAEAEGGTGSAQAEACAPERREAPIAPAEAEGEAGGAQPEARETGAGRLGRHSLGAARQSVEAGRAGRHSPASAAARPGRGAGESEVDIWG